MRRFLNAIILVVLTFVFVQHVSSKGTQKIDVQKTENQPYDEPQFHENTIVGNWKSYKSFIEKFPQSSWIGAAQDSIFFYASKTLETNILQYCCDHFSGNRRNTALLLFHDVITDDGEMITLNLFYTRYNDKFLSAIKSNDYKVATLGNKLELFKPYVQKDFANYDKYIRKAAPREKAFVALQRMMAHDIASKNWKAALNTMNTYSAFFGQKSKHFNDLMATLKAEWDNSVKINNVGVGVNTLEGGEYAPVISADDKLLYFCGKGRENNIGGEDIFVSAKKDGLWGKAKLVQRLSQENSNDAPLSVSSDGTVMNLFQSGQLFFSVKTNNGWSTLFKFPKQINSCDWQSDALLSSDGKALMFTSIKNGGYNLYEYTENFHGDFQPSTDIYVSLLNENDEWGQPINLGNIINTPYAERTPFLHPDMKTLYFSSDGHGGLGKHDVYKSTRLADSCWNCWSEPVNLGKEINTEESDWCYKISTDGEKAYFSKQNNESENDNLDIYSVNLPKPLRPQHVATISGKLLDRDNQPVAAEIRWEDLETWVNVGRSKSDPTDGSFFIALPKGKIYGYYVESDDYYPVSNNIDLRKSNDESLAIEKNINMVTYKQMVDQGIVVSLNNSFFNTAESTLLPYSLPELRRIAAIIKSKNLKVEISGHTDNVGNDDKNMLLSQQRAEAVRDFLVQEGCLADKFVVIGYGELRPVASNDTEDGRAKNRRVELRFVK